MTEDVEQRRDEEARARERRRLEVLYRQTPHYKKWDRVEQVQARRFKTSVADIKPIFDCLGMIAFSATIFGLAIAGYLAQPMDDLCERPISITFALLGLVGLLTGLLACRPVGHLAMCFFAGSRKSSLAPFHPRVVGQPRSGTALAGFAILIACAAAFTLAYAVGEQVVIRTPPVQCVGPLP